MNRDMYCPKCGIRNPDDAGLCRRCGTLLQSQTAIEPKKRSGRAWLFAGGFLLLPISCGIAFGS